MRTDKGEGISGTTSASAACITFSETSDMPGAQSKIKHAYFCLSGRMSFMSRVAGFLR